MKLNPRCIRDILRTIEELSDLDEYNVPKQINIDNFYTHEYTSSYDKKEIIYTLRKLKEANYIIATFKYASGTLYYAYVTELTFEGHQFLATISNNEIFDKTMKQIDKLGSSVTVEVLKSLATKFMKEKLGL